MNRFFFFPFFFFFQWDILSNGGVVQEMAHIANGRDHGNCVSLLRVNVSMVL
jgi:homeobox-leucine zipper protein